MAIIKVVNEPYYNGNALENMFHYLSSQNNLTNNTDHLSNFMGGCNFLLNDVNSIAQQFKYVMRHYHKADDRQLIHFIISFPATELKSVDKAKPFADFICSQYSRKFQILYAIHHKPNNLHIHFILNPVSFADGHRIYSLNGFSISLRNDTDYYFGKNIAHFA